MRTPSLDSELIEFSREHLFYELHMFWRLAQTIPESEPDKPSFMLSVLLDSFVLHLKNLIEFFCMPRNKDYVRAQDFFDNPSTWTKKMGTLTNAYRRANEEASHLTRGRKSGTPPDKKWNTVELLKEIDTLAKEFAAKASHTRLDSSVREFLAQPTDKMVHWLEKNTMYSNVAAQTMISTSGSAGSPLLSGAPTATVVIRIK